MTMITPSYLGETIEYSSLHACRSTLEDPTLNPEEKRNAEFQGAFKWWMYRLSRDYENALLKFSVLSEKQIVRMQDTKLFSEIVDALLHGVKTTTSALLDKLYKENDREFLQAEATRLRFEQVMDSLVELPEIHNGPLMRPHLFYSLFLAMSHAIEPCASLNDIFIPAVPFEIDRDVVLANLSSLAQALEDERPDPKFAPFVAASNAKTNVAEQRRTRIAWLGRALLPNLM